MAHMRESIGHASGLVQQGRLPEARADLERILAASPDHAEALHLAGLVEMMSGNSAAAVPLLERCVRAAPRAAFAWSNLGVACNASRDFTKALASFQKALELEPGNAAALKNQGIALRHLGRHDEAMQSFRRSAQREPNDPELHREVGDLLVDMGRPAEALSRYDRALVAAPRDVATLHNRAFAAWRAGDTARAERGLREAISIAPTHARAHHTLGALLVELGRFAEAESSHAQALALEPGNALFHNEHGIALEALGRREDAIAAYSRAIELAPRFARAIENRAEAYSDANRGEEALADYERAASLAELTLNPGNRLRLKLEICDWSGFDALVAEIARGGPDTAPASNLSPSLYVGVSPEVQHATATSFSREIFRNKVLRPWSGPAPANDRIRIGYFSADMGDHPVGQLLAPLAEAHDRSRVESIAFSWGKPREGDPLRARLERAFDQFIEVRAETPEAIAARARSLGIDVAFDLMGHTRNARTAIFAHRAAPLQAQFLGFPGTMGTACIDYLVSDEKIVPESSTRHYTEKLAWVRGTALVGDPGRAIDPPPARAALGLPAEAFVFCCFCNRIKLTPATFSAWMRILTAVEGSVLWLAHAGETPTRNLRAEAERHGVAPGRIVFAQRVESVAEHLARYAAADLFLDTFHYNGHVTTSDALYAGLPTLTCMGDAYPARVSASLLAAVGLPELVTRSPQEYVARAIELAGDRPGLGALRARLAATRLASPAFDIAAIARDVEEICRRMVERHRAGLPPEHIRLGT